ncbi:MAG TPA: hypothetical protein VGL58_01425 [Caulobacteraceae bacterium]|jgi:hypothetical protein
MSDSVDDLKDRLSALIDCASVERGPTRWRYIDEALKLRGQISAAEAHYTPIAGDMRGSLKARRRRETVGADRQN